MKYCDLKEAADYFYYPYNNKNCICDFQPNEQADYQCQKCGQKVRVRENIIEFITDLVLDTEKKREHLDINTLWAFPEDYFRKIQQKVPLIRYPIIERIFLGLIDAISAIGSPFRFGNVAICSLRKRRP